MTGITRNVIRCRHCGTVCESTHVHHYAPCRCGRVAADGGREYLRRRGHSDDFEELSEYEETESLEAER